MAKKIKVDPVEQLQRSIARAADRADTPQAILDLARRAGDSIVDWLDGVLRNDELNAHGGFIPIHVARALGAIGSPDAIDALVRSLLQEARSGAYVEAPSPSLFGLRVVGAAAAPRLLRALEQATGDDNGWTRDVLREALAHSGGAHEETFSALVASLDDPTSERVLTAASLAQLGDARALPILQALLERTSPVDDDGGPSAAFIEIAGAVETLGGSLTDEQRAQAAAQIAALGAIEEGALSDDDDANDDGSDDAGNASTAG